MRRAELSELKRLPVTWIGDPERTIHDWFHAQAVRNCVDVSSKVSIRQWRKRLGRSAKEVEAAVGKVGGNVESVIKELETKRE